MATLSIPFSGILLPDYSATIKVLVSPEAKEFTIPQALVEKTSKFLKAALGRCWKEGREGVVKLPEVDSACFNAYLDWMFTTEMPLDPWRTSDSDSDSDKSDEKTQMAFTGLTELYLLGHYLLDAEFMNGVIDAVLQLMMENEQGPGPEAIKMLWSRLPLVNCPLKKLIVKLWSLTEDVYKLQACMGDLPQMFLGELVQEFISNESSTETYEMGFLFCDFHQHDDGVKKCARSAFLRKKRVTKKEAEEAKGEMRLLRNSKAVSVWIQNL